MVVALTTVTPLAATLGVASRVTVAPSRNASPVIVTATSVPCAPEFGSIDETLGGGTTVSALASEPAWPFGLVTWTAYMTAGASDVFGGRAPVGICVASLVPVRSGSVTFAGGTV